MKNQKENNLANEELESYEIELQCQTERLRQFLDSQHYIGFSEQLNSEELEFYLDHYGDSI